jgi:anti-sigma factor RsiW
MGARPLTCKDLVELITDYLEGELPLEERQRFETHLAGCRGCRAYLDQMRQTIRTLGVYTEEMVPQETRDELLQLFSAWRATQ